MLVENSNNSDVLTYCIASIYHVFTHGFSEIYLASLWEYKDTLK